MYVDFVAATESAEQIIAYCARVSSPNQENPEYAKLLKYCITHEHWSVFEMANMVLEIQTSRAISAQILRHRSFSFQEFSQRYSDDIEYSMYHARRQDTKNRQDSIDDLPEETREWFRAAQQEVGDRSLDLYTFAIGKGIAKECARFLLPMSTTTKLYMNGTVRSWIHYINLRTGHGTQKEHMDIALECKKYFIEQFPIIAEALEWSGNGGN